MSNSARLSQSLVMVFATGDILRIPHVAADGTRRAPANIFGRSCRRYYSRMTLAGAKA
jgi:hypothetical protein